MSVWGLVLTLHFVIACLVLWIARFALPHKTVHVLFAVGIMVGAPLLLVSPGLAGGVFIADLIGGICLVLLAIGRLPLPRQNTQLKTISLIAFFLLIIIPMLGTMHSYSMGVRPEIKALALSVVRSLAYYSVFRGAIYLGRRGGDVDRILFIQAIYFALTCACGLLLQGVLGHDLNLFNALGGSGGFDVVPGFMGLYRGAIGAWGAGLLAGLACATFVRGRGALFTIVIGALILGGILLVGSRQGLLFGIFALVAGVVSQPSMSTTFHKVLRICIFLVGIIFVASFFGGIVEDSDFGRWVAERFDSVTGVEKLTAAAEDRDVRIPIIYERIKSWPAQVALLGTGFTDIVSDPAGSSDWDIVYVDSEIFWQFQQRGLLGLLLYVLMVGLMIKVLWRSNPAALGQRAPYSRAIICVICTGVLFTFGHFFLLQVLAAQVGPAYWNWMIIGLALGACTVRAPLQTSYALRPRPMALAVAGHM